MKRLSAPVNFALFAALIGLQALFVAAYVSSEHTIYFWDHVMYFDMARQFYAAFDQGFSAGWTTLTDSFAGNYNLVFALPSLISFALFGVSRTVFIVTNYFVFFLAYEIAVALLLRRALNLRGDVAFAISLIASALIPPLWLPLLEGYPDSGAAACIVFAAVLAWDGPERRRMIARALAVGAVLGFAVLLRRHFVYAAIALLAALAGLSFWDARRARKGRQQRLGRAAVYFLCCGIGFVCVLALIAPDFLQSALTTDYTQLYLSYKRPALTFLYFVLGGFGLGLLLIAASGVVLLARIKGGGRLAVFALSYTFLWLIVWCLGPDQMGHHYILHALPLFVAIGLSGWFIYLLTQTRRKRYVLGGALAVFLAANSAWTLWLSPTGVWPNDNGTPGLFSAPRPPVVRSDYDEWLRLADYLHRTTGPDDLIMMIGSSFVFNQSILHGIYADLLDAPGMFVRFPKSPEIDHMEATPLDVFAASNVYVVPEPAQYHLDPEGQRVVTASANRFPPPPARASMFHADDVVFHLADGVTVKIWRRGPWVPGALHDVLSEIRRDGPQDAGFAQDWVMEAMPFPLPPHIFTDTRNATSLSAFFNPEHRHARLFFDYPLQAGDHTLGLSFASDCAAPQFRLTVVDASGHTQTARDFAPAAMPGTIYQAFSVPAGLSKPAFLQLDLTTGAATLCRAELRDMLVE